MIGASGNPATGGSVITHSIGLYCDLDLIYILLSYMYLSYIYLSYVPLMQVQLLLVESYVMRYGHVESRTNLDTYLALVFALASKPLSAAGEIAAPTHH